MTRPPVVIIGLVLGAALSVSSAVAQDQRPRQFYSKWESHGPNQKRCKYYFKSNPDDQAYRFQYVVAENDAPKEVWFYNSKGEYWCAAPTDPAKKNKWFVFSGRPTQTIAQAVQAGENRRQLQDPPKIPGSPVGDPEKMLFPPHLDQLGARE
jgi:hypothetical protein